MEFVGAIRRAAWCAVAILVCASSAGELFGQTGWSSQDIGSPAIRGSAIGTTSGFTVTAGGSDIWGTSDQFQFVYQKITGDVDVRARVASLSYSSAWAKAGVMIRGSLSADAAHGFALVSPGHGTAFQRRTQAGGASTNTVGVMAAAPEWVRVVRQGSIVSAYASTDGTQWTLLGQDTITLPSTAYVGLAVTSHDASAATTASFSGISATLLGLPGGQRDIDLGAPAVAGAATYAGAVYRVRAGGADIWGTADQFHYVYQPVSGDVDVSVRIDSIAYADKWSKAGLMIRETLTPGSAHASVFASAGRGYAFQRRPLAGAASVSTAGTASAPPGWVRLTRSGALVTAYQSSDGKTWTAIGSDSIPMASAVYVGIAVTSHNTAVATDVTAEALTITQATPTSPVPAPGTRPTGIAFTASPDHATVTSYRIDIYTASANPDIAAPVASLDAGKPVPDATNTITVSAPSLFAPLLPGTYQVTVSAVSSVGVGRSEPIAFAF